MEFELKHVMFKHPFTCLISGPTGSGKTLLIRRILKNYNILIYNLPTPIKILWCYGIYQQLIKIPISDNVITQTHEGLPSEEIIKEIKPNIIIVDDLMFEIERNKSIENFFTRQSHHLNISIIFSVQNLFNKSIRTISLNSQYIILMKNARDGQQIKNLARQIFPDKSSKLINAYNDATKHSYGYIKIDLTPDTPENLRLHTRITPEEVEHLNKQFSPIIYKI